MITIQPVRQDVETGKVLFTSIPGDQVTHWGEQIWEGIWEVKVRYIATLQEHIVRDFGVATVGNRKLDRQMHNDMVNIMVPIDRIVEYFKVGERIIFRNGEDTTKIYRIVNNYLLAWTARLSTGLNNQLAGNENLMSDLMLLDRFAEALFPVAQTFGEQPRSQRSLMVSLLTGQGRYASRDRFMPKLDQKGEVQKADAPKHASVGDALVKSLAHLRQQANSGASFFGLKRPSNE